MEKVQQKDFTASLAFLIVLPLCLLGTALATFAVFETTQARDQARFRTDVQWTLDAISSRVNSYIALLHGGAGLFASNPRVDRASFAAYVGELDLPVYYRGIQGIGFARRVRGEEKERVLSEIRRELGPGFQLTPEGDRAEKFPIVYLEPMDRRNQEAIGYDMFSETVRKQAMTRARDTGEAAASGKVILVQEIDLVKQPGFLIYVPFYSGGAVPDTVEQRREKILGFIYSPFRAPDFFSGIFQSQKLPSVHFEVYDGIAPGPENLLYSSGSHPSPNPMFSITNTLEVAGRPWAAHFRSTPAFAVNSSRNLVWGVAGSGLLLSMLVVAITHSLSRARAHAVRLQAASARLASIVESSDDAILSLDLNRVVATWNAGAERLFGFAAQEMIGRSLDPIIPPEQQGEDESLMQSVREGHAVSHHETVRLTKDGKRIDVSVTISPLKNPQRTVVGASKIFRDISDRKRAERELRQAEAALKEHADNLETVVADRTQKLRETIGELEAFSYSLSHDMRTPLRTIQSYSQFLLTDFGPKLEPQAQDFINRIVSAVQRMDRLISDVLSLTRLSRQEIRIQPVDLDRLVRALIMENQSLHPPRADVAIVGQLPVVSGHEASLVQCVSNLLGNAVKFVGRGVTPVVRVYGSVQDGTARIVVEDNGIGIPEEAQGRVFELFHRHHSGGGYEGTGLGLAIVRKAVERMSGQVGVESSPGHGSRFWFELPVAS